MAYVYRYIDIEDNTVKYVGIVYARNINERITAHASEDNWRYKGNWRIEYFECENRSEAEAFESHLIALYETHKYFNKAKKDWGINKYLPDVESWWQLYSESCFVDLYSMKMAQYIRKLIKSGRIHEAAEWLVYVDVIE